MRYSFYFVAGVIAVMAASICTGLKVANATDIVRDDIIGQWRNVVTNPAHKNTVSKRYMRHTFFDNGILEIEEKKDIQKRKEWGFKDGIFIVNSRYKSSKFIEYFKLVNFDELIKIKFRSIVDGKILADYNPKDRYLRLGSVAEKGMKKLDVFKSVNNLMDFVDPSTLKVGSKYTISKKTPIMPHYNLSNFEKVKYAQKGQAITIIKRKKIGNYTWYQVKSGDSNGWVNSIALFGQTLR